MLGFFGIKNEKTSGNKLKENEEENLNYTQKEIEKKEKQVRNWTFGLTFLVIVFITEIAYIIFLIAYGKLTLTSNKKNY
jgi:hypothetical protein